MAEIRKNRPNKFLFNLFNIIEDERIEYNTTQNYPGYANFIGQAKYYYFDLLYKKAEKQDDLMDVLQKTFNSSGESHAVSPFYLRAFIYPPLFFMPYS